MNKENDKPELPENVTKQLQEVWQEYTRQACEGGYASLNTAWEAVKIRHARENQTPKP